MFKIAFSQAFDEGFLTSIPYIPIPEYGQSSAPLERSAQLKQSQANLKNPVLNGI